MKIKTALIQGLKNKIETWVKYYSEERPHSSLHYLTPKEFQLASLTVEHPLNFVKLLKEGLSLWNLQQSV